MFRPGHLIHRKSTTQLWNPSDSEEAWLPINGPKKEPNYTKTEITYSFNSEGFRCDEFALQSDERILFLGCSYTEGIGLPLGEVWPQHIINKIRNTKKNIGKKIPFWSLAIGAAGTDTESNLLSLYHDILKPSRIIYFLPNLHRRDLITDFGPSILQWGPWFFEGETALSDAQSKLANKLFIHTKFAYHQSFRSLSLISKIGRIHNSKIDIIIWDQEFIIHNTFYKYLMEKCSNINIIPFKYDEKYEKSCPSAISRRPEKARDNMHPGAMWQWVASEVIWGNISHNFE